MSKPTKEFKMMEEILQKNIKSPMAGVGPRDSDTELIIQILQLQLHAGLTQQQLEIIRSLNLESIVRSRRKLQSQGLYIPDSAEVAKRRRVKDFEIQQVAPKETASGLQKRIAGQE